MSHIWPGKMFEFFFFDGESFSDKYRLFFRMIVFWYFPTWISICKTNRKIHDNYPRAWFPINAPAKYNNNFPDSYNGPSNQNRAHGTASLLAIHIRSKNRIFLWVYIYKKEIECFLFFCGDHKKSTHPRQSRSINQKKKKIAAFVLSPAAFWCKLGLCKRFLFFRLKIERRSRYHLSWKSRLKGSRLRGWHLINFPKK